MPKENITDMVQERWRTEVSWGAERRICSCSTTWSAPVPDCSECGRKDVLVTSGHVQIATVNLDSLFEFPANPNAPEAEPAEAFDGWRVTLDEKGIERTIDALVRAGTQAFPNWKRDWSTDGPATP